MSSNMTKNARIVAITNQKGGVGKTTTAINLSSALIGYDKKVLLVDLDPQGNASTGLGVDTDVRDGTTYELITGALSVSEVVYTTHDQSLDIIPATVDLSSVDVELAAKEKRSFALRNALQEIRSNYDFIIVDCPPSLNLLTVNAMVAADSVIVPLQSEFFALEGLSQLMLTIREIRKTANPNLRIDGILLTMHDTRNNLAKQVESDARSTLSDLVFTTVIPRNVRLSEAPSYAVSVLDYDSNSTGSKAYKDLAYEFLTRIG